MDIFIHFSAKSNTVPSNQKSRKKYRSNKCDLCYYHVTYMFQSESTLYICLNVLELPVRWSLRDSNGIRTYNHLVRKRTLNRLAKLFFFFQWLSCVVSSYLYGAFDCNVIIMPRTRFSVDLHYIVWLNG